MAPSLTFDKAVAKEKFPFSPFPVKHPLVDEPLFELENLLELSKRLSPESVEYNAGNLDVNQDPNKTPATGLSVQDTIARIRDQQSWMVLKNVEVDPDYKKLMDLLLDTFESDAQNKVGKTSLRESFIFITSPKSVTPYHIDPEHNFLLQIRGDKKIHIWDPKDRNVISEDSVEKFFVGGVHRNQEYHEKFKESELTFVLKPGDGLYFPVAAPHWVENLDEVSVSFSITFRSEWSERNARIYQAKHWLRNKGFKPTPVGKKPVRDNALDLVYRVARKLGRITK